jgi:hypothetical protein
LIRTPLDLAGTDGVAEEKEWDVANVIKSAHGERLVIVQTALMSAGDSIDNTVLETNGGYGPSGAPHI